MKKELLVWLLLVINALHVAAQSRTVTGKVTDTNGDPLPGVTVQIKGTTQGTVTIADGTYKLDAPADAVLVFSYIGYDTQEVPVNNRAVVDARMGGNRQLSEVVVTALGITREKKALGYAVQSVQADELTRGANPNLATAIQGKVAGVEVRPSSGMPGASAQIFIRGARFFDGNNAPLYVVDGMPINSNPDFSTFEEGTFGVTGTDFSGRSIDIDPNDIESINVLKGQAAAALYGMRASNGAIIITTKSGKGMQKGKPVVSFATNWQIDHVSRFPELQQRYAQGTFPTLAARTPVYSHFNSLSWGPEINSLPDNPTYGGNVPNAFNNNNPTDATRGRFWSPQAQAWLLPQAYDNPRDFFETGLTASNSISISQAGGLGNYAIGLSNTNQSGIVPSTGMNRYNVKFAGNFDVSEKVKVGASANFATTDIDRLPTGNNSILFQVFGAPPSYNLKGIPYNEADNPYKQLSYRGGSFDNPYWSNRFNVFNEKTRRLFGNAYISYNPINDLNIRYQVGTDQYTTDIEEIYELGAAPTGSPTFNSANPSPLVPGGGQIINRAFINRTFNSLLNITYNKQLGEDFRLNILGGNEVNDNSTRMMRQQGNGFNIGGYHNLDNTNTQTNEEEKFKRRTVGFFLNPGLDWKQMLYLNLTGRYDIVSNMPRGNRSFFYPSVSLAWVISELESLRDKGFYAKVRASYAEVGAPASIYLPRVYTKGLSGSGFITDGIQYPFNSIVGYRPNTTLYDPDLKPQNTKSIEAGAELGFFNNRLGVDYTFTKQNTVDQIFAVPLAGSTGFSQVVRNGGELSSDVHEAVVRGTPVKTSSFEWNISINFTKVINKTISLAPGVENIFLGGFVDPQVRAAIGYTYPAIYGTTFLRTDEGKIIIDDDTSSITYGMPFTGPDGVIGTVTPDFILGGTTSFQYKFIRLSALVEWKKGGQIYSGSNRLIDVYGTSKKTEGRATDRMLIEGVKASTVQDNGKGGYTGGETNDVAIEGAHRFYRYYNLVAGSISEANVYGTSFVKLREIALTVDLPKKICERTRFIKAAALTVSARNILLWTELPNFDPESSQGNGNMQGGFDYMSLPQTRSIGAGLNLTF